MDSPDYGGYRTSTSAEVALCFNYVQHDPARTPVSCLSLFSAPMRSRAESHTGNRIKGFLYLQSTPDVSSVNSLTGHSSPDKVERHEADSEYRHYFHHYYLLLGSLICV